MDMVPAHTIIRAHVADAGWSPGGAVPFDPGASDRTNTHAKGLNGFRGKRWNWL